MRPHADRIQAAILGAAAAIAAAHGAVMVIEELRCRDWASLTLAGARHELDVRLEGAGARAAHADIAARLPECDVPMAGRVLADLVVEPTLIDGGDVAITISALVIND